MCITLPIGIKAVVIGGVISCFIYYLIDGFLIEKMFNYGALKQLFFWGKQLFLV